MKIAYFIFLSFVYLSFHSCSELDETPSNSDSVEVVFKANKMAVAEEGENNKLSVLAFKSNELGVFSLIPIDNNADWTIDENGSVTKRIILSTGTYRFLMARGFSSDSSTKDDIILSKEEGAIDGYDCDYYFEYPSATIDGGRYLRPCSTELFIDSNEPGFELSNTKYNLFAGNKFSVSRKITRLQGRLDFMVRRGEKTENGEIELIPEGANNENALFNALTKITSIQVTANNVSTRCHVNDLLCDTPGKYLLILENKAFLPFNSENFVSELSGVEQSDYSDFDNSAYIKGPLLFPAPKNATVDLDIIINYEAPLQPKQLSQKIELNRNQITLVKFWLFSEDVGVHVTVDQNDLIFEDGTGNGDDGWWN